MFKVQIFQGVGDTLYQRHFIKRLSEIYPELAVGTPWPQLLWDIPNIKFWWRDTILRTQERNMLASDKSIWAPIHKKLQPDLTIGYDDRQLATGMTMPMSFAASIKKKIGVSIDDYSLDLQLKPEWITAANKIIKGRPICLVRPPTLRREWKANSRNPKPGVMTTLLESVPKEFVRIGISYNEPQHEWVTENLKYNEEYLEGQIPIEVVAALIQQARLTISPVGFVTPMSIAVRGKCLTVVGGHVSANHFLDPRMDLSNFRYVSPEPHCNCFNLQHSCNLDLDIDKGRSLIKELIG